MSDPETRRTRNERKRMHEMCKTIENQMETGSSLLLHGLLAQAEVLWQEENEVLASELKVASEDSAQYETALTTKLTRRLRRAHSAWLMHLNAMHSRKGLYSANRASSHRYCSSYTQRRKLSWGKWLSYTCWHSRETIVPIPSTSEQHPPPLLRRRLLRPQQMAAWFNPIPRWVAAFSFPNSSCLRLTGLLTNGLPFGSSTKPQFTANHSWMTPPNCFTWERHWKAPQPLW